MTSNQHFTTEEAKQIGEKLGINKENGYYSVFTRVILPLSEPPRFQQLLKNIQNSRNWV